VIKEFLAGVSSAWMLMISPHGRVHGGPREELFDRGKSPHNIKARLFSSMLQ
jgi:hypothetical protein